MPSGSSARRRATLAMVAEAAGVSLPTASKVLNGRGDVASSTRARVEEAARELDYVPPVGRRSVTPARVVDLVFDDLVSPYSLEVLRGVTEAGTEAGVDVVVNRIPTDDGERASSSSPDGWANRLKAAGREGIIIVTSELTEEQVDAFDRAGLPLVVIDPLNLPRVDVTSVGATNFSGGLSATEHLLSLGHRRIGFAGGPVRAACGQARLHGYRAALEKAGVPPEAELALHGAFSYPAGLEMGSRLLDSPEPPTAVFAASDTTALGVIEAARRRGLRVPDDLSVVGFDDTILATLATPALTVVRQPLLDMGRVALRTLLRLAAGESLDSHHVELATQLVVRDSTAPRRGER
ncbi:LacI family DNA-binding transcriptional regulator [Saccharomonospora cyanea]|uniref:Transcriptional regulator n=1 Tax=Saccharomonospora cyanea NA-134 TaxID=882082 RepID=H5XLU9_9PSEU|nr:LacI family DNA-binding transcriptional regulator [Saccharomonospora cyanea]EHR61991.1 transcriptional regulator [Saccharomonospora cyanea NA-134]